MKSTRIFVCALSLTAAVSMSARVADEGKPFTIRGEIEGLEEGDTLRFERIDLPGWIRLSTFDVVVQTPGTFEYTGRQTDIEYLCMKCLPREGKVNETDKIGVMLLVDGGTVTLRGSREWINFCSVEGEVFGEQPLLREAGELEKAVSVERGRYLQSMHDAHAAGDTAKRAKYMNKFNEYHGGDSTRRAAILQAEFLRLNPSSPWSVVRMLERSSSLPVDSLETYHGRLDDAARNSRFGTLLRKKIDARKLLLPGNPAPYFTATLPDGSEMRRDDFRGKYLLIYHWGMCPGSIQLESRATELYDRFRDHLEVLGITDQPIESYAQLAARATGEEEFFGVNFKAAMESMAAHRWIDIETEAGENGTIGKLYDFAGFPFFVLVSPDGVILSRGFHDTFFEAKKNLEERYGEKKD